VALSAASGVPPRELNAEDVRRELIKQGAVL